MNILNRTLKFLVAVTACALLLQAEVPSGWSFGSASQQDYECSIDPAASYNGQPSTYIKSKDPAKASGFGTMTQGFSATQYLGKRVRLSANLKSQGVEQWSGLWMRVDDANHPKNGYPSLLAFDNMHDGIKDRSIKGTTEWQTYEVVLDVPEAATSIYMGFLLAGAGEVWVNGIKLEVVGPNVPVTGKPANRQMPDGPMNLGFEK